MCCRFFSDRVELLLCVDVVFLVMVFCYYGGRLWVLSLVVYVSREEVSFVDFVFAFSIFR